MGCTAYDRVEPHMPHTVVWQIDFQSDAEDGSQIGQRMGISKIVWNHCCQSQKV